MSDLASSKKCNFQVVIRIVLSQDWCQQIREITEQYAQRILGYDIRLKSRNRWKNFDSRRDAGKKRKKIASKRQTSIRPPLGHCDEIDFVTAVVASVRPLTNKL